MICMLWLFMSFSSAFLRARYEGMGAAMETVIVEISVPAINEKRAAESKPAVYTFGSGNAAPYLAVGRPIWLVGLSFDSKTHHLVDCAAIECKV